VWKVETERKKVGKEGKVERNKLEKRERKRERIWEKELRSGEKPWDFRWVFISVDGATTSPYNCQVIFTHTLHYVTHTHTHFPSLSLPFGMHTRFLSHTQFDTLSRMCFLVLILPATHKEKKTETGTDQMEKRVENVFFVGWKFCVFFCNALHSFSRCELCQLRFAVLFCKCILDKNK